jgi:hypothetical protein
MTPRDHPAAADPAASSGCGSHVATDLGDDRLGQRVRCEVVVVEAPSRAVAAQPVGDMELLLEVVAQRHEDERTPRGDQLPL